MTAQQWADLSNVAIYSTMFVLVLAMIFFAASFAGRRTVDARAERAAERPVAVAVGGTGSAAGADGIPAGPSTTEVEPGRRAGNIAMALTWLAFALLLVGLVTRGVWAGRAPWGNMYEFSLSSALAALGVFLVLSTKRDVRWFGVFLIPAVLLTLGLAVTVLYTEAAQLVPALDSYWLVIHVSAAIICGGAFVVAGLLSLLYLVRDRADHRGSPAWAGKLPPAERLDTLAYRTVAFTMPLWTFAIVAGAIWAEAAWGRYWGWDPKETWALITWLVFAGYLHARATAGWRGRRAAWLGVIGTLTFIFNYFAVNLIFPGLHSYAGV
jgi:cytochrome c-type biogenesis protein CcsB